MLPIMQAFYDQAREIITPEEFMAKINLESTLDLIVAVQDLEHEVAMLKLKLLDEDKG